MRFENLVLEDYEINSCIIDFDIEDTDELIDITNYIRKKNGNTDLVGNEYDNEVYYNFYLICYPDERRISILAICNNGENDDFCDYLLPITNEERENLLFQVTKKLSIVIDNEQMNML